MRTYQIPSVNLTQVTSANMTNAFISNITAGFEKYSIDRGLSKIEDHTKKTPFGRVGYEVRARGNCCRNSPNLDRN